MSIAKGRLKNKHESYGPVRNGKGGQPRPPVRNHFFRIAKKMQ